jgi:Icc-related predicted phosphoesterase
MTEGCEESIQVGDMGAGFVEIPQLSIEHRFIRGNHDDPSVCKAHPNWIADGTKENGMFFLGGAFSIDWQYRMIDVSWWEDEEVAYSELEGLVTSYEEYKPEIVVTHDCPTIAATTIKTHHQFDNSRTRQALDEMFKIHKPRLWIFGHHHHNASFDIEETEFICLDELTYVDI